MNASMRNIRGMGLIELMISMTLGLATVGVIGWVYLGSIQTYRTHDSLSRMQESARYAFEFISKDLRMAGTSGCSLNDFTYVAAGGSAWYNNLFTYPVKSIDKTGTLGALTEYGDTLSVLRADISTEYVVQAYAQPNFTLKAAASIPNGEYMVATDCLHAAVFKSNNNAGANVGHSSAGGDNTSENLGPGATAAYAYGDGSRLFRLNAVTYFIGVNGAGVKSLFRRKLINGAEVDEELVEGVEDMMVTYSVDSNTPRDGTADYVADGPYLSGDTIATTGSIAGTELERWQRVVSVRVSLLMATVDDRVVPEPQVYTYRDPMGTTAGDRRLHKVFTHVVKLRNR